MGVSERGSEMFDLKGKVAVVTGASRGVGRGIAIGLGEAGATVYVTGRTTRDGDGDGPGTIYRTADEVTFIGGRGIPVRCDHRLDREVEALFDQVGAEQGRLDILVNNVWGGYQSMMEGEEFTWMNPFWKQPMWRWDAIFEAGVRGHFTASRQAAPMMIKQGSGLIVNVSYWAGRKYMSNVPYGVAKAATDKMVADMAYELRPHGVAAVSLYPGVVRTEKVMSSGAFFDLSNSESPQFAGRAVAALATDPNVMQKSGQVLVTAALGLEYGFTDVDGKQPRPLTLEEVWG
jgi:NAD(P)-dependent dehydrogenase (short-subunit alcohol dehydrogenase family)